LNVTKKGKAWEILNSLWIIFAVVFPANFIAFLYIGNTAKNKKWVLSGFGYLALTFVFPVIVVGIAQEGSKIFDLSVGIAMFFWLGSIVHAFLVRKKYLLLREDLLDNEGLYRDAIMKTGKKPPAPPSPVTIRDCKQAITLYLRENSSTPFFRERLTGIARRLDTFEQRYKNAEEIITRRFETTELSYTKFAAPVVALQDYIIKLADSLVTRMNIFNEEEYEGKIGAFANAGRADEAEGYKAIEQEYQAFATQTLAALDDAILKLDRLVLEISKLSEADIEKALSIMHDLEEAIGDIKYYK